MENDVSLYFREIMEKAGMDYIPDSGIMYHKTLKFSSVLNIKFFRWKNYNGFISKDVIVNKCRNKRII